ncbi:MAG: hypothetical protein QF473_04875, partial [Planctomycetota bacterium]|nr:hypothetical protein [Planctomycetota bacterium]
MSEHGLAKLTMTVLVAGIVMCASARADVETLWTYDYGAAKVRKVREGVEIVEDKLSAGGKALRLSHASRYQHLPGAGAKDL